MKDLVIWMPLFICLAGGVLFLILRSPGQADYKALAKDMFWVGLLAVLLALAIGR